MSRRPRADRVTLLAPSRWDLVADWEQLTAYPFMVQALEAGAIVAVMAGRDRLVHGPPPPDLRRPHARGRSPSPARRRRRWRRSRSPFGYFGACGLGALALAAVGRATGAAAGPAESAAIGTLQAFALGLGFLFVGLYGGQLAGLEALLFGTFLGITQGQVVTLLLRRGRGAWRCSRSSAGRCSSPRVDADGRARRRRPGRASSASPSCCCSGWRSRRPPDHRRAARLRPAGDARGDRPAAHRPPGSRAWRSRSSSPCSSPGSASRSPTSPRIRSASG